MAELKHTRQRAAILQVLSEGEGPRSAEEVFSALHDEFPNLALSTVYRNLERFSQEGLVRKESFNDGVIRYTATQEHGHYLICTVCDKKIRLEHCPLSDMEKELARDTGFEIDSHSLTLYGKCPACLAHEKDPRKP